MEFLKAFLLGGALCAIGQILIDETNMTPARILTGYVVAGVVLGAVGLYPKLMDWGSPSDGFRQSAGKGRPGGHRQTGLAGHPHRRAGGRGGRRYGGGLLRAAGGTVLPAPG